MSTFAEFNPIHQVHLGPMFFQPRGLVVVVGANSSGKTLFLRDVERALRGHTGQWVVASQVDLQVPANIEQFIADLVGRDIFERADANLVVRYGQPGREEKTGGSFAEADLQNRARNAITNRSADDARTVMQWLSPCLTTSLFIDNRLHMHRPVPRIRAGDRAGNDVQALFLDTGAQDLLEEETLKVFGKSVWLDSTTDTNFILRTSDETLNHKARFDVRKMAATRALSEEGDGLKSYVGILIALLVGRTFVRLIDEPELCLHPPQAYAVGQFIGSHAKSPHHATFVATHSSAVLRGILESAGDNVTVLRLRNRRGAFEGTVLDNKVLLETIRRPGVRAETVLDGVFAKAALVVEADGDREVYSAASEKVRNFHRDVAFIPVNGTGGVPSVVAFYKMLGVPLAVIADLDMATDESKRTNLIGHLAPPDKKDELLALCRNVSSEIAKLPPTITPDEAKTELRSILDGLVTWEGGADKDVMRRLSRLRERIKAVYALKRGGLDGYPDHPRIAQLLRAIIDASTKYGLFLVPVGELENWLDLGVSRERKADWAEAAVAHIRAADILDPKLKAFLEEVLKFLAGRM